MNIFTKIMKQLFKRKTLLVLCILTVMSFCADSSRADLVAHYTFDDGTFDDSVGGFHGTGAGDATVVNDPERGMVLSLDGTDDYVNIPETDGEVNEFTIAMWIYTNVDLTDVTLAGGLNTDTWNPQGVHLKMDNGVVQLGIEGGP